MKSLGLLIGSILTIVALFILIMKGSPMSFLLPQILLTNLRYITIVGVALFLYGLFGFIGLIGGALITGVIVLLVGL
jgi:hypothetical protein